MRSASGERRVRRIIEKSENFQSLRVRSYKTIIPELWREGGEVLLVNFLCILYLYVGVVRYGAS